MGHHSKFGYCDDPSKINLPPQLGVQTHLSPQSGFLPSTSSLFSGALYVSTLKAMGIFVQMPGHIPSLPLRTHSRSRQMMMLQSLR